MLLVHTNNLFEHLNNCQLFLYSEDFELVKPIANVIDGVAIQKDADGLEQAFLLCAALILHNKIGLQML